MPAPLHPLHLVATLSDQNNLQNIIKNIFNIEHDAAHVTEFLIHPTKPVNLHVTSSEVEHKQKGSIKMTNVSQAITSCHVT